MNVLFDKKNKNKFGNSHFFNMISEIPIKFDRSKTDITENCHEHQWPWKNSKTLNMFYIMSQLLLMSRNESGYFVHATRNNDITSCSLLETRRRVPPVAKIATTQRNNTRRTFRDEHSHYANQFKISTRVREHRRWIVNRRCQEFSKHVFRRTWSPLLGIRCRRLCQPWTFRPRRHEDIIGTEVYAVRM